MTENTNQNESRKLHMFFVMVLVMLFSNTLLAAGPRDTNGDGYGNICDPDKSIVKNTI